jgi:hypothetical protein
MDTVVNLKNRSPTRSVRDEAPLEAYPVFDRTYQDFESSAVQHGTRSEGRSRQQAAPSSEALLSLGLRNTAKGLQAVGSHG